MKFDIGILQMAQDLVTHASSRQSVIAQNIANADTPGYKAQDVRPFSETFAEPTQVDRSRYARVGHIELTELSSANATFDSAAFGSESPNGNTVSVEDQMVRAADVRHKHDLALGIYGKSIDILRAGMGRIR